MKQFLAGLLVLISFNSWAAPQVKNKNARIYDCNPFKYSYCPQTKVYGYGGYGLIVFEDGSKYPVRPGGKDVEAAIMGGTMRAFLTLQRRMPDHQQKFYHTDGFKAWGYFGDAPNGQPEKVFYLTRMVELKPMDEE